MRRRNQLFFLLALQTLLSGCASVTLDTLRADLRDGQGYLIETVPFIPQRDYYCGPASLAMVLRYWGADADQDAIASELFIKSIKGTLNFDLEFYARRQGFEARSFRGSLAEIKAHLRQNRPLIVFQDLGLGGYEIPHFAVLIGYNEARGEMIAHSGTTEYKVMSHQEFLRTWERRQRWTLLITPKTS